METTEIMPVIPEKPAAKPNKLLLPLIVVLAVLGIALLAWFVWPTVYQYRTLGLGFLGKQTIRTNRLTRASDICGDSRWQPIKINGDMVSIPNGTTLTIGRSTCARTPVIGIVLLALIGLAEAALIVLFILNRRRAAAPAAVSPADAAALQRQHTPEEVQQMLLAADECYEKGARLEEVLEQCDAALRLAPESAYGHNLRGIVLQDLGRTPEAIEAYREAIRLDPAFEEAQENLANAEGKSQEQA